MSEAPGSSGSSVRGPSNLQLRAVSAVVLIVLTIALTWAGGLWFRIWCVVIAAAILHEWTAMMAGRIPSEHRNVLFTLMAVLLVALLVGLAPAIMLILLVAAVAIGALHAAWRGAGAWPVLGLGYAGLSGIALAALRGADAAGFVAMLFLFAVVWATDIFAYFVGKAAGGPKLAPSISPGKTQSGALGGAVAGVIAGIAVAVLAGASVSMVAIAAFALALSVVSQAGDLFESSLKRRFQIKDSGSLIPGHGGVMDRVDGLVAAAAAFLLLGMAMAGADLPGHAFFHR